MRCYETSRQVLVLAVLAALMAAVALVTWKAVAIGNAVETEVRQAAGRAERQIAIQGEQTRELVRAVAADVATRAERQVAGLRGDLAAEAAELRKTADARLASIQADAREQIVELRLAAVSELSQANGTLQRTAGLTEPILRDLSKTSSLMFDCEKAPHTCVAPRLAGTLRSVEVAAGQAHKTMQLGPRILGTFQQTNQHIERYVERFTRPKSFFGQAKDIGLTLAGFGWRVARN
ncbi:MAG: hypothetical protein ACE15B_19460 [Bryobacteraceae bacterium]